MIKKIWASVRNTFTRGVVILVPVALTVWILNVIFTGLDQLISPILLRFGVEVPGLGFASMILLVFLVGLISRNLVGNLLVRAVDVTMKRIPLVRTLYSAIKDVVGAFSAGREGRSFRHVVVVEYPRKGIHSVGFVTNELGLRKRGGKIVDVVGVYFPHPPNPTSGVLVFVPQKDVHLLDMTVQEGLKLALSGGIIAPSSVSERVARPLVPAPNN